MSSADSSTALRRDSHHYGEGISACARRRVTAACPRAFWDPQAFADVDALQEARGLSSLGPLGARRAGRRCAVARGRDCAWVLWDGVSIA